MPLLQSGDRGGEGLHAEGSRILIDARTRKGPFFHLSQKAGAWCFTVCAIMPRLVSFPEAARRHLKATNQSETTQQDCTWHHITNLNNDPPFLGSWQHYNNMYHPRCVIPREEGGMDAEYEQLCNRVAVINVAVERQIQVKGPDAEKFVDFVITRKASAIKVSSGSHHCLNYLVPKLLASPSLNKALPQPNN